MFQKKANRWIISITMCVMVAISGKSGTKALSSRSSWIDVQKNNLGWTYTISIQPQDIGIEQVNGRYSFRLQDCHSLQVPGQPSLLHSSISQEVTHNADVFIQNIVWSPLKIQGRTISKNQIRQSPPMYATNYQIEQNQQCELPGSIVDLVITGDASNAVCIIQVYPLQIRSGIVFFAKEFSFVLVPRLDEPFQGVMEDEKKEIIICPDAWKSSANRLKMLHAQKGFSSEIVLLSEVQRSSFSLLQKNRSIGSFQDVTQVNKKYLGHLEGWDGPLALQLQAFLQNRMKTNPYQYITLLGDSTLVPASVYVSLRRFDFSQSHDFYNEIIPSDFFYMSPNGGGSNLVLESYLGRIPVRTLEECDRYIEKIACWNQELDIDWFSKKALVGGDLFHHDYIGELLCQHLVDIIQPNENTIDKFYLTDNKCNDIEVSRLLQNGHYGFINICAHGSGSEIRLEPGFVDVRDCMNFQPESALPIVFSYSCMNGAYDTRDSGITYETDPVFGYPTSFGQSLLLSPAGAIAFVGGSRVNYSSFYIQTGSQGEIHYTNPQLMDAICTQFFSSISSSDTLGEMCKITLQKYVQENVHYDFSLQSFVSFTLLGDPTIQILQPEKSSPTTNCEMDVDIESLIELKDMYRDDSFFLDSSIPLEISFSAFEKLIVFNYKNSEKRYFEKDVSHETMEIIKSLAPTKICVRLIHTLGYEKRYMIHISKAESLICEFPFTHVKHVYPGESLPYYYQISNTGYQTIEKATSSISIRDFSGNTKFSDTQETLHIEPLESITERFLTLMPSQEGKYTVSLSLSYLNGNDQVEQYEESYNIVVSQHPHHYRIGIPVNSRIPVTIHRNIPVHKLNDDLSRSTEVRDTTFEYCIFPSNAVDQYIFHGMLLFDDVWQDFSKKISSSIIQQVFNIADHGGVVLGFAPNSYHEDVNRSLLEHFGIETNTFSFTNYSRHLEPLHILQQESSVYQKDEYYIPSRANWEPFFPLTWGDIPVKEGFVLAGTTSDQRIGLIHNAKNCFFVSCSFLSLDPEKKSDDVLVFIEDIITSQTGNNPVSSIAKRE